MATKQFVGRAAAVAQVTFVEFSSILATETYEVAINGKAIVITSTGTSLATLIDAFIAAWGASDEPEHRGMTASEHVDGSSVLDGLTLTANTPGEPITVTADASTGTATVTDDVAASGPNFWNLADNWSGGTLPSAGDDLELIDSAVSIKYGLTDTNVYASLKIFASFTGEVGLPATNVNGYPEYRTRRLTLGDGTGTVPVTIGEGVGNHAAAIRIDMADTATTLVVYDGQTNQSSYPIELLNLKSTSTGVVYGGGVVLDDSTSGTIASLKVLARASSRSKPKVKTTSRVTVTACEAYGQGTEVELNGNGTTLVVREYARVTTRSAAAIATVTCSGRGIISWQSSGGISTKLNVQPDGQVDFSEHAGAKTVAACDLSKSGTLRDPYDIVTWTSGVVLQDGARLADVTLDLGPGITVSV